MRQLRLVLIGIVCGVLCGIWVFSLTQTVFADTPAVMVDGNYPAAAAVQSRIQNQLKPDDHISVQVWFGPASVDLRPNTTAIVVDVGQVVVAANDGWLDQVTADELLMRAKNITQDRIDTVIVFIRSVHTWQDQHPRPVPPPPPAAPINWTPWLIAGAIALVVGLFIWLVLRRHRRYQNLARRADEQQRAYDSGDLSWVADFKKE